MRRGSRVIRTPFDPQNEWITETVGMDALEQEIAAYDRSYEDWFADNPDEFENRCREASDGR